MCGITASIALQGNKLAPLNSTPSLPPSELSSQLDASVHSIVHRGPDSFNHWVSPEGSHIGLGHARLSINDLSPSGTQPLHSDCGTIHAVVNGEIYDQDRLWRECRENHGYTFSSESDSELVVALYKIHGVPGLFKELRGEFAFVLYDSRPESRKVIAARDRFGIKPLVWTLAGDRLLVASETKALKELGWNKPQWDVDAIVSAGWMLDERTLFKGVQKVLPGQYLEVSEEGVLEKKTYWDAEYEDKIKVETRTIDEMVQGVRERLVESIRLRLRADVPVGIYLSGGIDSSAVAGIVTHLSKTEKVQIGDEPDTSKPITCFSVRFPEESGYDESSIADRTAKWLGVDTIKIDVDEARLAQDFQDAAYHCEHHHFDLNTVAKFALSTLPRDHGVKVVLTGEGADEHFAGYPYFPAEHTREPDLSMPQSELASNHELRNGMQKTIDNEMRTIWRNIGATQYDKAGSPSDRYDKPSLADANARGMAETVLAWHPSLSLFRPWLQEKFANADFRETVLNSYPPQVRAKMRSRWHPLHTALYMWNKSSLANVLLSCLGDRTEMAHSVEARTPFLDHHLAEYVNRLPPSVKLAYTPPEPAVKQSLDGQQGPVWKAGAGSGLQSLTEKWILREAVKPFITEELYQRRKHPFLAPTKWPKGGPLHNMFQRILTKEAVEGLGFVDWTVVEKALVGAFGGVEGGKQLTAAEQSNAFRTLAYVGAWVTLGERFGVESAAVVA